MDKKIIWQPQRLSGYAFNFGITLDSHFASEVLNINLKPEQKDRMNRLFSGMLTKYRIRNLTPLYF